MSKRYLFRINAQTILSTLACVHQTQVVKIPSVTDIKTPRRVGMEDIVKYKNILE